MGFAIVSVVSSTCACDRRSRLAKEYPPEVTQLATQGGPGLPYFVGKDLSPVWDIGKTEEIRGLKAFQLVDQLAQTVRSEDLRGKVAVVSFFFSRCTGICPLTAKNLAQVQKNFLNEGRLVMLSVSITPQTDDPPHLRAYARANQIDHHRWHLLTGDRTAIYRLARESFGADTVSPRESALKKISNDDFLHSENVYLIDGSQHLRGVYSGRLPGSIQELIADARTLIQ